MINSATFASLDEAWNTTLTQLPDNPYKSEDYQRKVLKQSGEFGVNMPREPDELSPEDVKKYLQHLYEDSGAHAVDSLLPPGTIQQRSSTSATKSKSKKCSTRKNVIEKIISGEDPGPEQEDDDDDELEPPRITPDLIFFVCAAAFLVWWILSSEPQSFST
jgi:hypothetical protein